MTHYHPHIIRENGDQTVIIRPLVPNIDKVLVRTA